MNKNPRLVSEELNLVTSAEYLECEAEKIMLLARSMRVRAAELTKSRSDSGK